MNKPASTETAPPSFANTKTARVALIVTQSAGLALLLYWSIHLTSQWQYFDVFRRDAAENGNPLLAPVYRIAMDVLAMIAGALMLGKSKWALLPNALHFVAYLCFLLSITGYNFDLRFYPMSALLTLLSQILVLALLLWLEKKKALGTWPLRAEGKRA